MPDEHSTDSRPIVGFFVHVHAMVHDDRRNESKAIVLSDTGTQGPRPGHIADSTLAEIVDRLVKAVHPDRIYLFGSHARGTHREDSDYDVLLIIEAERSQLHALSVASRAVLSDIRASIDIVVMTPKYFEGRAKVVTSLPATVLAEGRLLHVA